MQFEDATQATSVAIRAIFNRWTALSLTITHHFNGATYLMDDMLHDTVAMATHPTKRYDQEAYTSLFYDTFDKMHADIQDGSPEQVANHILRIRDAAAVGNFAPAAEAAQKAGITVQAVTSSVSGGEVHVCGNLPSNATGTGHDVDMTAPRVPKSKPPPVIDEDGFQTVDYGRKRR